VGQGDKRNFKVRNWKLEIRNWSGRVGLPPNDRTEADEKAALRWQAQSAEILQPSSSDDFRMTLFEHLVRGAKGNRTLGGRLGLGGLKALELVPVNAANHENREDGGYDGQSVCDNHCSGGSS